jgi:malonate transporter
VLTAFVPIWALTVLGYLVGRSGVLGDRAELVLGRLVFHVAMPAVLLTTLSRTPVSRLLTPAIIVFALGTLVVGVGAMAAGRWLFGRGLADRSIGAMAACYVNSANLGVPVAISVLGDASFIVTVLLFQVLVITPIALTLVELDVAAASGHRRRDLLTLPVRNPIIAASALGVTVSALGWRLSDLVNGPLTQLGAAAVPTALLVLGMSLHNREQRERTDRRELWVIVLLKAVAQPLVAFLAGEALGLDGHLLLAVVLCSALPTAQNVFVYAHQYALDTRLPRNAVLLSTVLSMVTLSGVTALLRA